MKRIGWRENGEKNVAWPRFGTSHEKTPGTFGSAEAEGKGYRRWGKA